MLISDKQIAIPRDMISQILRSDLSMIDLGNCRRVCSLFKEIIDGLKFQAVWKNGLKMDFLVNYNDYNRLPEEVKINWQGLYIQQYDSQKALKNAEINFDNKKSPENLLKWGELLLKREDRTKNSRAVRADPWAISAKDDRDKAIQNFLKMTHNLRLQITFARLMCYSPPVDFDDTQLFCLLKDLADSLCPTVFEDLGLCYLTGRGIGFPMKQKGIEYLTRSASYEIPSSIFLCYAFFKESGNESEALRYLQMAADEGLKEAQCILGMHLMSMDNYPLAFEYLRKSALKGEQAAQYVVAMFYKNGLGTESNAELCLSFAKKSAEQDNPIAFFLLGQCYEEGFGVPKDLTKALVNYKLSAIDFRGFTEGQHKVATCYYEGIGTSRDLTEALRFGKMAADNGNINSQLLIAQIYKELNDFTNMFKYTKLAADNGDPQAQSFAGACLFEGIGTEKDPQEALKYFTRASEQNDASALFALGQIHLAQILSDGKFIERNDEQMFNYFQRAVDAGMINANLQLAACYDEGYFVKKNHEMAFKHYKIAADEGGDVIAQCAVGNSFFHGEGVECDMGEAFRYTKIAADKGDALGNYRLGDCYESGYGTEIDLFQALKCYVKAADEGHQKAQKKAAEFYREGKGCVANPNLAEMYAEMAETEN